MALGLNPHLLTLGKPLYLCVPAEVTGEGPNGVSSSLGRCKGDSAAGWLWPGPRAGAELGQRFPQLLALPPDPAPRVPR